jgi:hypothetical protein
MCSKVIIVQRGSNALAVQSEISISSYESPFSFSPLAMSGFKSSKVQTVSHACDVQGEVSRQCQK